MGETFIESKRLKWFILLIRNPSQELKECAKVNTSIIEIKQQKSKLSNEKNKSSGKCEISKNYMQNVNLKKYNYFYAIIN